MTVSMESMLAVLAGGLGLVGAWWGYLASPRQQWRSGGPWPARYRGWPAAVCLLASLFILLDLMGAAAAFFTWLTGVMLVWSLAPFAGAWRAAGGRSEEAR
ncbi:hypothetical protein EBB59_10205 [Lysobacter pythonis]|uniref:DUF3325 domain-containing protein n=1 Tax=Solilutibacter pythonis TaxID=2483112 RepID=A0A3M2HPE7_9GAMM|nr:hypothetical protein [Lysobacter pythonis]RMH89460.1 hypothetical protein EBB59_10205 [Lysobacter pythonis]